MLQPRVGCQSRVADRKKKCGDDCVGQSRKEKEVNEVSGEGGSEAVRWLVGWLTGWMGKVASLPAVLR